MSQDLSKPPRSIPYLISTLGDIKRQQTLVDVHKARWQATYPHWNATHEAKLEWLRKVENGNDGNCLHDVKDALKEILCETVATPITVQLLVRSDNIGVARTIAGRTFHMSSIYYPTGVVPCTSQKPIMYIVAQECVDIGTRSDVLVPKLLAKAGFPIDSLVRCAPPRGGVGNDIKFNEEWPEFVGEGVHFPISIQRFHSAVAFEVMDVRHRLAPFERELQSLAHAHASLMPAFVLVQKSGFMTDTVPTAATHDPIWYCERIEFERCRWHVRKGLGETDEVRRTLDNSGVAAAKCRLKMIQGEINYVRRIGGPARWRRKLATLLALTLEIRRDLDFVHLSGSPKEAAKVFLEIAEHWRTKVLMQRTNEELGLSFNQNSEMGVRSRAALFVLLKRIQNVVESTVVPGYNQKFTFNCLPKIQEPPPAPTSTPTPTPTNVAPNTTTSTVVNKATPQPMKVQLTTTTTTNAPPQKVITNRTPMVIQKAADTKMGSSNGVDQLSGVQKAGTTNANIVMKTNLPTAMMNTFARVVTQKRLMPGSAKPSGRTPNDSKGLPMKWDSVVGIWRSTTNANETKMTNVKVARTSGMEGMVSGNAGASAQKIQTITPISCGAAAAAAQKIVGTNTPASAATPMEVDTGRTTTATTNNAPACTTTAMNIDKTNVGNGTSIRTDARKPASNSAVACSKAESNVTTPAPNQSSTLQTCAPTSHKPVPAPETAGTHDQSATTSTAKPVENPGNTTTTNGTPVVQTGTLEAAPPTTGSTTGTDALPSNITAGTTTTTTGSKPESSANVGATVPVAGEMGNGVMDGRNNSARPAGRAPHDKNGNTMLWDGVNRLWRSLADPSETRTPNLRPVKLGGAPTAGGSPLSLPTAMAAGPGLQSGTGSPRSSRPVGRAPNDSSGAPMVWDTNAGVWRSVKVANEIKRPKLKPPPHTAVFTALQKE